MYSPSLGMLPFRSGSLSAYFSMSESLSSATTWPQRAAVEMHMPFIGSCAATCGLMSGERLLSRQQSMSSIRVFSGVFNRTIRSNSLMVDSFIASWPLP